MSLLDDDLDFRGENCALRLVDNDLVRGIEIGKKNAPAAAAKMDT